MQIDFNCIYETNIELGEDYWKFYLEEIKDLYIICFFDKNEIYLMDIFSDKKEILYKYENENKINNNLNEKKKWYNKN